MTVSDLAEKNFATSIMAANDEFARITIEVSVKEPTYWNRESFTLFVVLEVFQRNGNICFFAIRASNLFGSHAVDLSTHLFLRGVV